MSEFFLCFSEILQCLMGGFIARQLYHTGAFKTDLGISAQMPRYMQIIRGFPGGSDGKESAYNAGDPDSIPGLGRSPGEGNGNPLLEIPWTVQSRGLQKVGQD